MGRRQDFATRDDEVLDDFASSVVGTGGAVLAVAATADHRVLELVDESGQAGFSDAVAALNELLDAGTLVLVVTERTLVLGYRTKGGSGSPEHLLTVSRDDARVVGAGNGRVSSYLTLKAGPLVLQAHVNRWTPKRTSHADLGAVATALGKQG